MEKTSKRQQTAHSLGDSCYTKEKIIKDTHGDLMTCQEIMNKTKERVMTSYWWPGMDSQIKKHISTCDKCQKTRKDKRPFTTFITPLPQCSEPNQRVHMDMFGSLKTKSSGKRYILCVTDAFSKYAELVAMPEKSAITLVSALFSKWLCRWNSSQTMELSFATKSLRNYWNH